MREANLSLRLIHLGSWGNDVGRPDEEMFGDLKVRDIASFGHWSLERVLREERPAVAVFLSTQTFAHRALIRYCRKLRIPTVLLYHGIASMQAQGNSGGFRPDRRAYARFILTKLYKTLRYTLPCYAVALLRTGATWYDWRRFAGDIVGLAGGRGPWRLATAPDARPDYCLVYTQADVAHAISVFGFDPGEVQVVGNPDLARFGFSGGDLACRMRLPPTGLRSVMYIDTALSATGLVFSSRDAFAAHLLDTARALNRQGLALTIKPHPATDSEFLAHALRDEGVRLVGNEEFIKELKEVAACIVEPTSLALIPALMGIPMLYAQYGRVESLRYGPVLQSYPRGRVLNDVNLVAEMLSLEAQVFHSQVGSLSEWITANSGPLPAERMPERVACALSKLCEQPHQAFRNAS